MLEDATVRKRSKIGTGYGASSSLTRHGLNYDSYYGCQSWKFPLFRTLLGLTFGYLSLFILAKLADEQLPTPVLINDAPSLPGRFVAERAYNHLQRLTSLGPRVAGSYENEIRAVDLLSREVAFIKHFAHPIHHIEVDLQRPSGVMTPKKAVDGVNTIYYQLTNLVVKIGPSSNGTGSKTEALLVNAHFDSVAGSPGASDNGVNVAVALEVLEVLSRQSQPLKRPVVFLFNGAEEKAMLGAHGFITQHKWAKEIGAFINLDACGAGGREIVFQAGPGNSWLMNAYAASAPYPFATIMAQEVFEARVIPSDTDYKILKDYGHIPGMDLAHFRNGYVYHTKYDDLQHLSLASIQRTGDNLKGLVSYLVDLDWPSGKNPDDNTVFFDYLGMFMVVISNLGWHLLNCLLIGLAFHQSITWVTALDTDLYGGSVCKQVVFATLAVLFQIVCGFVVVLFAVGYVTLLGINMSWYSRPWLLFGLYGVPALSVALFISLMVSAMQQKNLTSTILVERIQFEGAKLNLTLAVILCYMFGLRSNVMLLMWLATAIGSRWLLDRAYSHKNIDGAWFILHFLTFVLPVLETFYLSDSLISVLIPVAGRNGLNTNPDLMIAMLVAAVTLMISSFALPLAGLIRNSQRILLMLITVHVLVVMAVLVTPLGHPYTGSSLSGDVRPQRVQILHVERRFYRTDGRVAKRESGYWLFGWDYHVRGHQLALLQQPADSPEGVVLIGDTHCHALPYCGLPYYFPYLNRIRTSYWVPASEPPIYHEAKLELVDQNLIGIDLRRFSFHLMGPDHMALMIWPVEGVDLVGWSPSKDLPHADRYYAMKRPLYFVNYFYGVHPTAPYNFTITLKVPPALSGKPVVEIAVTSHILHGSEKMTPEFAEGLNKYPDWMYAHGWTATYSHWSF